MSNFLPGALNSVKFYLGLAHMSALQDEKSEEANVDTISPKSENQRTSPVRRRRRVSKWQRGQLSSWKRKRVERPINGDVHVKVIIINT